MLAAENIGQIRARCKEADRHLCVVEFDRVSQTRQVEIARKLESIGYRVISGSTDPSGPKRYASDLRLRRRGSSGSALS